MEADPHEHPLRLLVINRREQTIEFWLEPDGWFWEMPAGARWELRARAQSDPIEVVNGESMIAVWLADGRGAWVYENGEPLRRGS